MTETTEKVVPKTTNLAPEEITNKDVTKAYLRWHFANEIPHSFERYLAPSLLYAMMPLLKKLYKDDEQLKAAYMRQLLFFNTQLSWGGGVITGLMASMEQERAKEEHEGREIMMQDDLMYNTKAGLMGALAQQGSALGAIFPFVAFALYQVLLGVFFARQSFKMGRNATGLMQSAGIQKAIEMLSVLGLFMMGILAGNYVKVSSTLQFKLSGREFVVQDILDQIVPGLLPLAVVMGVYWFYTKKGLKVTQALLWLTGILIVLATVGIL